MSKSSRLLQKPIILIILGVSFFIGGEMMNSYIQGVATTIESVTNDKIYGKRPISTTIEIPPHFDMVDSSIIQPTPVIAQIHQMEYQRARNLRTFGDKLLLVIFVIAFVLVWFGIWRSWRRALVAYCLVGLGIYFFVVLTQGSSITLESFSIIPIWPVLLRFLASCLGIPFIYSNC